VNFDLWCEDKTQNYHQFRYWATVMEMEICLHIYVRSLREANFTMYLDALTEFTPWFFALDHTHYSRWISVHLRDMSQLSNKHPQIKYQFDAGHFTVRKTKRVFSNMPIDQAHEQNNACIKGDGGAVGLLDNPRALQHWMVAGPEIARVVEEFERAQHTKDTKNSTNHHDQTKCSEELCKRCFLTCRCHGRAGKSF